MRLGSIPWAAVGLAAVLCVSPALSQDIQGQWKMSTGEGLDIMKTEDLYYVTFRDVKGMGVEDGAGYLKDKMLAAAFIKRDKSEVGFVVLELVEKGRITAKKYRPDGTLAWAGIFLK
jgi:hypothetical protein